MIYRSTFKIATGFGLVELLVAMGLSLLLLAGVATMFVSSRGAYETNDRLARLEENGRFALDTISRDVRAAGYSGCTNQAAPYVAVNNVNNFLSPNDPTNPNIQSPENQNVITINPPIEGFNYTSPGLWTPTRPGYVPIPANGSDILVMRGPKVDAVPVELTADMTPGDDASALTVAVAPTPGYFKVGQLLMIGDCRNRSYFTVTGYTPSTGDVQHIAAAATSMSVGNWTPRLGAVFKKRDPTGTSPNPDRLGGGAQIYTSQTTTYYVALSTASQTEPDPTKRYNSLWRQVDSNTPTELVEGVESMQLLYGLDTDGDGIPDNPNPVANNPSQIASVTIALLVRSLDEYGTLIDSTTYDMLGSVDTTARFTAPSDHRQRQLFTTTIWIRNR